MINLAKFVKINIAKKLLIVSIYSNYKISVQHVEAV